MALKMKCRVVGVHLKFPTYSQQRKLCQKELKITPTTYAKTNLGLKVKGKGVMGHPDVLVSTLFPLNGTNKNVAQLKTQQLVAESM